VKRSISSLGLVVFVAACGTSASMVAEDGGDVGDSAGMDAVAIDVAATEASALDATYTDTTEADATDATHTSVTDSGADAADAADATDAADAADAAPTLACDPAKPFGNLAKIPNVNLLLSDQTGAGLAADELTIYFARHATSVTPVLYTASRASTAAAFGTPVILPGGVNTSGSETASVTSDGLTLFFDPIIAPSTDNHIWTATRATRSASFGSPAALTAVNSTAVDRDPYVLPDGRALYFSSSRAGSPYRIYRAPLGGAASPVEVTELTSATFQALAPVVAANDLAIYFATDRGLGGSYDIWVARRTSTSTPFGTPASVAELNTTAQDLPAWISDDGCRMVFISNRAGDSDIWLGTRPL
jgi:hypothetical protein